MPIYTSLVHVANFWFFTRYYMAYNLHNHGKCHNPATVCTIFGSLYTTVKSTRQVSKCNDYARLCWLYTLPCPYIVLPDLLMMTNKGHVAVQVFVTNVTNRANGNERGSACMSVHERDTWVQCERMWACSHNLFTAVYSHSNYSLGIL